MAHHRAARELRLLISIILLALWGFPSLANAQTVIDTIAELEAINTNLSGNYILGTNFDATNFNFTPIGNDATPFSGTLNGGGFSISNLSISSSLNDIGLFGAISNSGSVQDLHLTNVNIIALGTSQFVGALAGSNQGTIAAAQVTGRITANSGFDVGGLVGQNTGSISSSSVAASVTVLSTHDGSVIGGLVGVNGGTIVQSNARGSITAASAHPDHTTRDFGIASYVGGLVGENDKTISQSSATNSVSGGANTAIGGLVGFSGPGQFFSGVTAGTITQSHATGTVTGGSDSAIGRADRI